MKASEFLSAGCPGAETHSMWIEDKPEIYRVHFMINGAGKRVDVPKQGVLSVALTLAGLGGVDIEDDGPV